jgi:hypothetical protein
MLKRNYLNSVGRSVGRSVGKARVEIWERKIVVEKQWPTISNRFISLPMQIAPPFVINPLWKIGARKVLEAVYFA